MREGLHKEWESAPTLKEHEHGGIMHNALREKIGDAIPKALAEIKLRYEGRPFLNPTLSKLGLASEAWKYHVVFPDQHEDGHKTVDLKLVLGKEGPRVRVGTPVYLTK